MAHPRPALAPSSKFQPDRWAFNLVESHLRCARSSAEKEKQTQQLVSSSEAPNPPEIQMFAGYYRRRVIFNGFSIHLFRIVFKLATA